MDMDGQVPKGNAQDVNPQGNVQALPARLFQLMHVCNPPPIIYQHNYDANGGEDWNFFKLYCPAEFFQNDHGGERSFLYGGVTITHLSNFDHFYDSLL